MAVQYDLAPELVPVLPDLVMLDHYHHKVHILQESVKVVILIGNDIFPYQGVIDLQRFREMPLLAFKQLQGGTLPDIIHILLVGKAVKTHPAGVG